MNNTIGERIVFLREEQDMTQKELAASIGITPTTLSRYENNIYEPKAEIISRLAKSLKTSADYIIGLTDDFLFCSAVPSKDTLTASEYLLLRKYRLLSAENQIRISERILTLLDMQNEDRP